MSKQRYFDDLTLEEMFKHHDHTYMMSDDNRYYEAGRREAEIINDKVESQGGWTKELCDLYNKYAPGERFQKDWEWMQKWNTAEQSSWSARKAHNLEVGSSNLPSATNFNLITMTYKQEQEALERAFVRQLLFKYRIKEVTTARQHKNGTMEFEFPVSTHQNTNEFYKKWLKSKGMSLNDTPRLRIACFKSGYVRKQNGTYSPYQLNKTYNQNRRHTYLTEDGLVTTEYKVKARALIYSSLARLNYMLQYYLKNYNTNTNKVR